MFIIQLTKALTAANIDYALVGGFAVALHGAIRGTIDVDLVINLKESDFIATEQALLQLGLVSQLPVAAQQVYHFRLDYIQNRNLIAWRFYNPKNPLHRVDIIITHDRNKIKTKRISFSGTSLQVASIPDLIAMKKLAGRPQDLADIQALQELL